MKQPIYKKHQVIDLFCPNCNEFIKGNGSICYPYKCICGVWERDWDDNDLKLKLKI